MNLLTEAMNGLGAVLLQVAAGLLLEELTLGGLVRLLMTPWLVSSKRGAGAGGSSSARFKHAVHNKQEGEEK
jgi:hypothetical protein